MTESAHFLSQLEHGQALAQDSNLSRLALDAFSN